VTVHSPSDIYLTSLYLKWTITNNMIHNSSEYKLYKNFFHKKNQLRYWPSVVGFPLTIIRTSTFLTWSSELLIAFTILPIGHWVRHIRLSFSRTTSPFLRSRWLSVHFSPYYSQRKTNYTRPISELILLVEEVFV
jgi:hypothetical protein